ncbi:anti-CBASS protein Acb1 family protein [Anaerosolibacter sp.]|uniref:anti-CBASS protein Acb1 family protein n=1 Tax=Anaerosolibacter sp. TaxID=1872527 RepID=UPI0039F0C4C8
MSTESKARQPTRSVGMAYRTDFMESSTSSKGTDKDPLSRQKSITRHRFSDSMISDVYAVNRMFANIIDIPAEDATREWISFDGIDGVLQEQIMNKLSNLGAQYNFQEAMKFERLRGDGFISIGAKQQGAFKISDEINKKKLLDIEYLHAFSGMKLMNYLENEDIFSPDYGKVEYYEIQNEHNTKLVHNDRLIHIVTRRIENEIRGIPMLEMLYDILMVFDNALWSTGQLMYSMVHKVLQTDGVDFSDKDLRGSMQNQLEFEFNTLSLAIIGKEDELKYISPSVSMPLKDMYDFLWEILSCVSRMPKSHIIGQPQGTITAGQFDSLNYYMRIAGMQEAYLREPIENLTDLLLFAKESGVGPGSLDPNNVKYKMKFNPLWKLDAETDAKIRKMNAEIDDMYIANSTLSPKEVRKERFGDGTSLIDKLDMSEEELMKIAKEVKEAKEAMQNE